MSQWYLSYNGQQTGPYDFATAAGMARQNPSGYAWRDGMAGWLPIAQLPELLNAAGPGPGPAPMAPPPIGALQRSDEIDFKIFGEDMQFVEVELDPGESCISEAGAMMYKNAHVKMETIFGDASQQSQQASFAQKLLGAGKRLITGESLFTTVFTNVASQGKAQVAFAAPYPGTIIPLSLKEYGGRLIAQKESFLCAAKGVSIGIHFQRKVMTALFGGEGFIMQKLEGDGLVFVHAGGTVVQRDLAHGEILHVDTGCVVAMTDTVNFDIEQVGGVKSMIFGGEGVFFARLTGPGHVWLQSLPFSRMAGRIFAAAPQGGGVAKGEGSVLGGLGGIISGDRGF